MKTRRSFWATLLGGFAALCFWKKAPKPTHLVAGLDMAYNQSDQSEWLITDTVKSETEWLLIITRDSIREIRFENGQYTSKPYKT